LCHISGEATPRWMGVADFIFGGAGITKHSPSPVVSYKMSSANCKCFTAGTVVKTSKVAYKNEAWIFQKQVNIRYIIM
jgi:hypothetical protein